MSGNKVLNVHDFDVCVSRLVAFGLSGDRFKETERIRIHDTTLRALLKEACEIGVWFRWNTWIGTLSQKYLEERDAKLERLEEIQRMVDV